MDLPMRSFRPPWPSWKESCSSRPRRCLEPGTQVRILAFVWGSPRQSDRLDIGAWHCPSGGVWPILDWFTLPLLASTSRNHLASINCGRHGQYAKQAGQNVAVDACFGIRRKAGCRLCFTGAGVWPLRSNERRQVVHGWRGYHDMSKTISVTTKIADEPHVAVQGEFQRI